MATSSDLQLLVSDRVGGGARFARAQVPPKSCDEEQGHEDYRHDVSSASRSGTDCVIFACRAGCGRSGRTGQQETSPLKRGRG